MSQTTTAVCTSTYQGLQIEEWKTAADKACQWWETTTGRSDE